VRSIRRSQSTSVGIRLVSCAGLLTLALGCRMSLSPVKNRIGVGVESYLMFDADGEDGQGDIYAVSASGGPIFRVTWSRAHESSPALSPDGSMLAFIRGRRSDDSATFRVWIMNLLNGAERELPMLGGTAFPQRVAWSADGTRLYVRSSAGDFTTPAPPARLLVSAISSATKPGADSALAVILGDPARGLVEPCADGLGVCVKTDSGLPQRLTEHGRDAFRWGADSVGYFIDDEIEVRPLAGGVTHRVLWVNPPPHPRTATEFGGVRQPGN
jgi:hypothetical protein